jgi:hypothetical protein
MQEQLKHGTIGLGLASDLFRNDAALEACLVDDRSHVLKGASGRHVAKLQLALSILEHANILLLELRARRYGRSTASAVLAYKKRRKIINYSYQTQADDIVGKMTIAALDKEMLAWEQQRTRNSRYCGDPIRGETGRKNFTMAVARTSGFSAPRQQLVSNSSSTGPTMVAADLDILWQPSTGAGGNANRVLKYLIKAITLLRPFGMGIMSSVTSPPDAPFPYDPPVDPDLDADCWEARKAAEKMRSGSPNVLRILACPFVPSKSNTYGATKSGTFRGVSFPPFILLNTAAFRTDECTLVHEMIHAANLKLTDNDHDPDKTSVFAKGNERTVLKPEHAAEINKAFFARRK